MEKWTGVTMYQAVVEPIKEMIEDGASQDEVVEEIVDYRERGVLPKSAVNWVINRVTA